jgi:uncharacterized cofD-like protein
VKKIPKIVSIAGGTGRYPILKGLKGLAEITAIFNITDSGGSSGILRDEHGVLPPGDGVQALAALAKDEESEQFLIDRFTKGRVNGHRIANLMFVVASEKFGPVEGMRYLVKTFCVPRVEVLPVSLERNVDLIEDLADGTTLTSEHIIDTTIKESPIVKARLNKLATALPETIKAILEADVILFGPGTLYGSIITHLLVKGIPEAINKSKAKKIMMCNFVTDPTETSGFKASDFAKSVIKYLGKNFIFDDFIVNQNFIKDKTEVSQDKLSKYLIKSYKKEQKYFVPVDLEEIKKYSKRVHLLPLVGPVKSGEIEILRHLSRRSSEAILNVWRKE